MARTFHWKAMTADDLPEALAVSDVVHVDYPERPEVFAERLALFPDGCLAVRDEKGALIGYVVMHPGILYRPPALDSLLGALPLNPDCLYIHDVALLPESRGYGLARKMMADALRVAKAHDLRQLALTAVNGSVPTWINLGFSIVEPDEALRVKLASYDAAAAYLIHENRVGNGLWREQPFPP